SDQTAPTGTAPEGTTGINSCYVDAVTPPDGTPAFDAVVAAAGYTDNCGGAVTATLTNTEVTGNDCAWTVTYTFTVTDACGNALTGQTYSNSGSNQTTPTGTAPEGTTGIDASYVDAVTPPEGTPAFDAEAAAAGYSSACGGVVTAVLTGTSVSGDNCGWTVTYTFTVTDICGNELTGQTIEHSGSDQTAPTGTAPEGTTGIDACYVDAVTPPVGTPVFDAEAAAAGYSSACSGVVTAILTGTSVSGDNCGWIVTYTFTVRDEYGKELTGQTIEHSGSNQSAPSGTAPEGTTGIDASYVDAVTPPEGTPAFDAEAAAAGYSSACGGVVTAVLTGTSVSGDNCGWTVTYTFTVTDICGNELTGQTIEHSGSDQTAPTGTAPEGTTGIDACYVDAVTPPVGTPAFDAEAAAAGYSSACGGTVTAELTSTSVSGDDCGWIVTYTFTVRDEYGKELTGQTIEHSGSNQTTPTGTAPEGTTGIDACYVDAVTPPEGTPVFDAEAAAAGYTDNCGGAVTATLTNTQVTGDNCGWTVTYTFKVSDVCGNELSGQTIVHSGSNRTAPTGTAPAGTTGIDACYVDTVTLPAGTPAFDAEAAASGYTDNCGGAVTATLTNTEVTGNNCAWTVTYTFTVTDVCGNELTGQTIMHSGSNQATPTGTAPAGTTGINACYVDAVTLPASTPAFDAEAAAAGYTDNCGGAVTATLTNTQVTGNDCAWTVTYTFTVTDACGNELTGQTIVHSGSNQTTPTGTAPEGTTGIDACYVDAVTPPEGTPVFDAEAAAAGYTDNCGGAVTATLTNTQVTGDNCGWTVTYTFKVSDVCGNELSGQTIVHSGGNQTAPSGTAPDGTTGIDACYVDAVTPPDGTPVFDAEAAAAGYNSACGGAVTAVLTGTAVTGDDCGWTVTYTFTIIDECGNELTGQIIQHSGSDQTPPEFTVPADIVICRTADCSYDISPDVTGDVNDETDNCSTGLEATYTDDDSGLVDCDQAGFIKRTWTLTDNCNNTTTKIQTIWIEPVPRLTLLPSQDTICSGQSTNIKIESPTQPIFPVRFDYHIDVDEPDSLQITTSGSGSSLLNGAFINETFNNLSNKAQRIIITFTPYTVDESDEVRCTGKQTTMEVWVEPVLTMYFIPVQDTICDNDVTQIEMRSITNPTLPVQFAYSVYTAFPDSVNIINMQDGRTGYLSGGKIMERIDNLSNQAQRLTYTVVPYTVTQSGTVRCTGSAYDIDIWVEPTPTVYLVTEDNIICDSTITNTEIRSITQATLPLRFDYTVVAEFPDSVNISNTQAGTIGYLTGEKILELIDNISDRPQKVTYTVSPYIVTRSGAIRCSGSPYSADIWVNPTPRAVPVNVNPAICYGELTAIRLESPTVMTSGEIRFDYDIAVPSGVVTEDPGPGTGMIPGDVLSFKYSNTNDTVQSVFFSITPKVEGLNCPAGKPVVQEVQLHPRPVRGIDILEPFTCESIGGRATLMARISRGAGPYSIDWRGPVGYTMKDSLVIANLYAGYYWLNVTDNLGCEGDSSISIANLSASPRIIPIPVLPNIHVSCPGGSDGLARIYVRDGITYPYEYWLVRNGTDTLHTGVFSGNYDTDIPTTFRVCENLRAGTYTLMVRDINGCETIRQVNLNEPDPIQLSMEVSYYGESNISCRGYSDGFVTAMATGGTAPYTYFWYPESGSLTVSNNESTLDSIPAGKYYVLVTDFMGCTKTDSITLEDPPGMELVSSEVSLSNDMAFNISCNGASDGYINIQVTGGSGNYTYSWTGDNGFSANTRDISGLKAGTYTCMVTDINGCILTPMPEFTLEEPELLVPGVTSSVSDDGSFNINCNGGTGSAYLTVSGGSGSSYSYVWTSSDGSGIVDGEQDQTSLTAGTYHILVTDLNGCVAETDITLTEPSAIDIKLIPSHITCQTSDFDNGSIELEVTGGIEPYTYLWSNDAVTKDISGLTRGEYHVVVTDANACEKSASIMIEDPPLLTYEPVVSDYNGFNITCYGHSDGSIQINPTSGTPPYVYSWEGPDGFTSTNSIISGLKAGRYILNITDSKMCSVTDTIYLEEPGLFGITFTTSESLTGEYNINCAGGKTGSISVEVVNNAGSVDYLWSDGEVGSNRGGLAAGYYKVITVDSNGCTADTTILLTEPDSIAISFAVTRPQCTDMPNGRIRTMVTGGVGSAYTYLWSDNSTMPDISDVVSGVYTLSVTDANGCSVSSSVTIEAVSDLCLQIPNAISPNGDNINDVWNIGLRELYPEMEVTIFNRWGETIWKSGRGYPVPWDGRSNGTLLPMDSYHYIINLHNGRKPIIGNITIVK
ncbi:MAG TPA: gliding motility-associated C-terminal domain-containing protein, partial [Bacteroidales bacterium]|nr:gliding motility-associated C-terminal domain-containing protein [Bacteroidales bacterium]